MNANQVVIQAIEKIDNQYNPYDYDDTPSEMQPVSWVDHQLLEIIIALMVRIEKLEQQEFHKHGPKFGPWRSYKPNES